MNSPESGRFETEPAILKIERHQLLAELESNRAETARNLVTAEVTANPELLAMLAKLIEGGGELSPAVKAHLRRMIALAYNFYTRIEQAVNAENDEAFHDMVIEAVQAELEELKALTGNIPDPWDAAYEDLIRLEGKDK